MDACKDCMTVCNYYLYIEVQYVDIRNVSNP